MLLKTTLKDFIIIFARVCLSNKANKLVSASNKLFYIGCHGGKGR